MPFWIRWMLVDSSGSRKPEARPSATTLAFHACLRMPVLEAQRPRLGERASSRHGRARTATASSSLMKSLQKDMAVALVRCWSGMRHCQPASCARSPAYRAAPGPHFRSAPRSRGRRKPVRPVVEAGFERLLDQQRAKTRAIDEEFAADLLAIFQHADGFDMAVFAVPPDAGDLASSVRSTPATVRRSCADQAA